MTVYLYRCFQPPAERHLPRMIDNIFDRANTTTPLFIINPGEAVDNQDSGKFTVTLDVSQYRADELSVTTINDHNKMLIVEGKHDERSDGSSTTVQRQFVRRYVLPPHVNTDDIVSELSADGQKLTISANQPPPGANDNRRRTIPIQCSTAKCNGEQIDAGKQQSNTINDQKKE